VDRNSEGTLVLASVNGNRVVEIPFASGTPGTALALFDYNDCTCQQWTLSAAGPLATVGPNALTGVSIYPMPASGGTFTLDLSGRKSAGPVTVEVLDLQGRVVYRRVVEKPQAIEAVAAGLLPGLFVVQVRQGTGLFTQKLTIL
jgi:arabinan endo-1,5-alpha-L-arabinosidase